ncbi:MAG: AraC family transcriptional regulator [Marinibacterium sp.]|nr:AraC family transcriptional regulator [Marinibacterium sp.]
MDRFAALKDRYGFQSGAGFVETDIPTVRFFWSTEPVERAPLIYNAGLVLILQGHKTGYLGDRVFEYDPDQYLVLSVPVPFDCATFATPQDPLLGLFIDIDLSELRDLCAVIDDGAPARPSPLPGVTPAPLGPDMRDALARLLGLLTSPVASRALGAGAVREVMFHALSGPHGDALRALTRNDSHQDRISRTIARIRQDYAHPFSVDDLARDAGMSAPVFHRAFKAITGSSPHQYLQTTRLHRAKGFILFDGLPVAEAARRVGYDNPAHFSRAFKKHFKVSPKAAQNSGYVPIDV